MRCRAENWKTCSRAKFGCTKEMMTGGQNAKYIAYKKVHRCVLCQSLIAKWFQSKRVANSVSGAFRIRHRRRRKKKPATTTTPTCHTSLSWLRSTGINNVIFKRKSKNICTSTRSHVRNISDNRLQSYELCACIWAFVGAMQPHQNPV